jgi:hypothetical protein
MLVGVGIYALLQTFLSVLNSLSMIPFVSLNTKLVTTIIVELVVYALTALAAVYFLARCANRFSAKIVESEPVDDTQISWLAVAFRLICVTAGVLFLYWSVPNLIVTVRTYISNMNSEPGQKQIYIGMSSITDIAKYVVLLAISIYLAYGAPAFVRWQVRMTLKQCGKIEEQQPTQY